MLKIYFDARDGTAIPDGRVAESMDNLMKETKNGTEFGFYITSSHLVIDYLRLLIHRGVLKHTDIEFWFQGSQIRTDKFGSLEKWPSGFCDHTDKILAELIDWKMKERDPSSQ